MTKGIFIVGTGTDVGKTVVTAGIMHVLRNDGCNATYFKAVLSGAVEGVDDLIPGDTEFVSKISGLEEAYENTTPYIYKSPISPHLAAKLENKEIDIKVVKEKYEYLKSKYDFIIAEGSGGIVCPLIDDESGIYVLSDLIKDLNMSVIVVTTALVGTINHTVLTVKYIESLGIEIKGIIMNNYKDDLVCNDNIRMIEKITKVSVIGKFEYIENLDMDENNSLESIKATSENAFTATDIISFLTEID